MSGDVRCLALEERSFGVEVLDDGFDDPVRFSEDCGVVEAAWTDARGKFRKVEGRWPQAREALDTTTGAASGVVPVRQIEKIDPEPGVGCKGSDLRTHDPGAEDGDALDQPPPGVPMSTMGALMMRTSGRRTTLSSRSLSCAEPTDMTVSKTLSLNTRSTRSGE